jgi:WD40 repeat protein
MHDGRKQVLPGAAYGALAFSPDGKALARARDSVTVQIWGVAGAREGGMVLGHEQPIQCLSFAPDGRTLVAGGKDHTVKVWNIPVSVGPTVFIPKGGSVVPDQSRLEVAAHARAPMFTLTPSGDTLVTTNANNIQVWDVATGRERVTLKDFVGPPPPTKLSGRGVPLRTAEDRIHSIALSPNGKLAAALRDSAVTVWDLATGELRAQIWLPHVDPVLHPFIGFTPDGLSLIAGDARSLPPSVSIRGQVEKTEAIMCSLRIT